MGTHMSLQLCYIFLIGLSYTHGDTDTCFIEDGFQANYTSGCQQYHKCSKHKILSTYSCPEGFTFQPAFRECVFGASLPCIQHICHPNESTLYAAPGTQCRFYYKCDKGVAEQFVCPPGSWFDIKKQECTPTAGVCYEPVCTGQRDGRHMDTTQGCRRSLICSGGNLVAVDSSQQETNANRCPSPRSTSVAFPIAGSDRCAYLPDGLHHTSAVRCEGYVVCKDGETKTTVKCPEHSIFDGEKCSSKESTMCVDGCTGKMNGLYGDPLSGCKEYYFCANTTSVFTAMCSDDTIFNGESCVPSSTYKCPISIENNLCYRKPNGFYRDFKDCSSYYYCSNEKIVLRETCPQGDVWNGKDCVKPSEFYCEDPVSWSGCSEKPTGYYQDRSKDSNCRKYYYCHKGIKISFMCIHGYVYDGENCVKEESYLCPSLDKDSCDSKPDGFYQQSSGGCRAYYMCSKGYKTIYLCGNSQLFNGEKCVDSSSYKCPYESKDCKGKSNGYHKDIKSNCRKYYFCENGEKLTTIQCSSSKIFNGRSCVNPKEYNCPVEGVDACNYKPDGYYTHSGSNCTRYFKCYNNRLMSYHQCPPGQIFNGIDTCELRKCTPQNVTCEKDGFYLDLLSRCKSYHICIDKRKNTLQCDNNQVFNGEICVPQDTFSCPDECSLDYCINYV